MLQIWDLLERFPLGFDLTRLRTLDIDDPRGTGSATTENEFVAAPLCELVHSASNLELLKCTLPRCDLFTEKCMGRAFRALRYLHLSTRIVMAPGVDNESVVSKATWALQRFRNSPLEEFELHAQIHLGIGLEQFRHSLELLEWRQLSHASSVFLCLRELCFRITIDGHRGDEAYIKDIEEEWRRGSIASAQLGRILRWKVLGTHSHRATRLHH